MKFTSNKLSAPSSVNQNLESRVMLAAGLPDSVLSQEQFNQAMSSATVLSGQLTANSFLNDTTDWKAFTLGSDVGSTDLVYGIGSKTIVNIPTGKTLTGRFEANPGTNGVLIFGDGTIFDSESDEQIGNKKPTVGLQSAKNATVRGDSSTEQLDVIAENQFAITIGSDSTIDNVIATARGSNGDGVALNGNNSKVLNSKLSVTDNGIKFNGSNLQASNIEIQQSANGTPLAFSGFLNKANGGLIENIKVDNVVVRGSGKDVAIPAFDATKGANEGIIGIETPGSFGGKQAGGNITTFAKNVDITNLKVENTNRPLVQILNGRPAPGTLSEEDIVFTANRQQFGAQTTVENFNIQYERDNTAPAVASVVQGNFKAPEGDSSTTEGDSSAAEPQTLNVDEVTINGQTAASLGIGPVSAVNPGNTATGRFV